MTNVVLSRKQAESCKSQADFIFLPKSVSFLNSHFESICKTLLNFFPALTFTVKTHLQDLGIVWINTEHIFHRIVWMEYKFISIMYAVVELHSTAAGVNLK